MPWSDVYIKSFNIFESKISEFKELDSLKPSDNY